MADEHDGKGGKDARKERLAAQLRANLMRRKRQARAKRTGAADSQERPAREPHRNEEEPDG